MSIHTQLTATDCGSLAYATESGIWLIWQNALGAFQFRHEYATSRGNPEWMSGAATTLEAAQDKIDARAELHLGEIAK